MAVWILLLRGINVGGAGRLSMADLRRLLVDLGCRHVSTLIQSGNAAFASDMPKGDLIASISEVIDARHGFRPKAILLTAGDLRAALAASPFPEAAGDPKPMHLFFHDPQVRPDASALNALRTEGEEWADIDGVLYLRAPAGIGRSKLAAAIGRQLKDATARNLDTCQKLLRLAESVPD